MNKATQKVAITSKFPKPKRPHITFKKAKSPAELTQLNHNYTPSPVSLVKRERLSLKNQQSKATFNKDLIPRQIASYKDPSNGLYVIGITGTKGKTSVAYFISEVLKSAGHKPFVLGALNTDNKDLSTPESADIEKFMRDHLKQGGTHFIMEVTSEGIDQTRISDIDFNIKLLTNITEDHLGYHKTFEKYQQAKLGFMRAGMGHKILPQNYKKEPINFTTQLSGHFNLLNIKAAASILRHINISENIIQQTLSSCSPPRGPLKKRLPELSSSLSSG